MSLRRTAAHLPSRSVHLRIVPRPANLSESREIFRVLQRFGEINTYKHLRYEYHNPADNVALAIFRTPEAAQRALNASPLRFSLEREVNTTEPLSYAADPEDDPDSLPQAPSANDTSALTSPSRLLTRTPPTPPNPPPSAPTPLPFAAPPPRATATKWFQVTLDRSRAVHQDFVERQPLWKQFTPMKSMAQEDLAKIVPHAGLADVSKRPPHAHRTPNKVLRKMAGWVGGAMPTLRGIWEESQGKRGQGLGRP
ncbi:uncharacterized protein M421DRAFT_74785 [Didymella exigua CBS 183.55]|uniref:RRM domain-containing protein n=1 Tax=Didymella exigua CBS 183.55 TaxID=1150837 RepID=A0A6A5RAI2_9PLEO|nr:uncharacterized protein M421DRAFT_74785 [Didymella exigua CBS 183.55]KAF1923676.1 hypothetical protein M421DRAFT_74785 [Didymella exigua CBS 183.55]